MGKRTYRSRNPSSLPVNQNGNELITEPTAVENENHQDLNFPPLSTAVKLLGVSGKTEVKKTHQYHEKKPVPSTHPSHERSEVKVDLMEEDQTILKSTKVVDNYWKSPYDSSCGFLSHFPSTQVVTTYFEQIQSAHRTPTRSLTDEPEQTTDEPRIEVVKGNQPSGIVAADHHPGSIAVDPPSGVVEINQPVGVIKRSSAKAYYPGMYKETKTYLHITEGVAAHRTPKRSLSLRDELELATEEPRIKVNKTNSTEEVPVLPPSPPGDWESVEESSSSSSSSSDNLSCSAADDEYSGGKIPYCRPSLKLKLNLYNIFLEMVAHDLKRMKNRVKRKLSRDDLMQVGIKNAYYMFLDFNQISKDWPDHLLEYSGFSRQAFPNIYKC